MKRTATKPFAAKPTALDTKLAEIDTEIARLRTILERTRNEETVENSKPGGPVRHESNREVRDTGPLYYSPGRHTALARKGDAIEQRIFQMQDERDALELNGLPPPRREAIATFDFEFDYSDEALQKLLDDPGDRQFFREVGKVFRSMVAHYGMAGPGEADLQRAVSMRVLLQHEASSQVSAKQAFDKLDSEIAALKSQIAELLEAPKLAYRGVWDADKTYPPGTFITAAGSVWHTHAEVKGVKPGVGPTWQLVVKRGRDGKDALK